MADEKLVRGIGRCMRREMEKRETDTDQPEGGGVPAHETGAPPHGAYLFNETLANFGCVAAASFNALTIAAGDDSPALTKYA